MICTEMTRPQLMARGFQRWSQQTNFLLIPASYFDEIPDGTPLECIDGNSYVKGVDPIDGDTRRGLLAYGIVPVGE